MRRDPFLASILGVVGGVLLSVAAYWVKPYIPTVAPGLVAAGVIFFVLLGLSLLEVPLMVFVLRRMAATREIPRGILAATCSLYVFFAAFYASLYVLLTSAEYANWGVALAALTLIRAFSNIWIEH